MQSGLKCNERWLDLSKTQIMGILNVTPDSFSDGGLDYVAGGQQLDVSLAVDRALEMVEQGASIIDVGGESTRPGADPVTEQQELDRVMPIVEALSKHTEVIISLDTSTASVITHGYNAGAGLVNDVRALQRDGALNAAAATDLPICLMHMQGQPKTMQYAPEYVGNVVDEVSSFLQERVEACVAAGVSRDRLLIDPGFGFGKTLEHNLQLLNQLSLLHKFGLPLLVGTSRKSMIGQVLGRDVDQRLAGSLATVAIAVMQGAHIIRVHDVAATVDVVRMTEAVRNQRP